MREIPYCEELAALSAFSLPRSHHPTLRPNELELVSAGNGGSLGLRLPQVGRASLPLGREVTAPIRALGKTHTAKERRLA
jgi:hypothetical protein